MNRLTIVVAVSLAAYLLLDIAVSAIAAAAWRTRAIAAANLPPAVRARRLFHFRLIPFAAAAAITLFVITPAFAIFEPAHPGEQMGPALKVLSMLAIVSLGWSIAAAVRSARLTARIERDWLRGAAPIDASRMAGLQAFAIESSTPIVALVGVFTPKLLAAKSVLDSCSRDEIACIVAHERGHFDARDNLKRWVMASLPGVLGWTSIHREILDAWHHAAEDAADDAGTGGHAMARAELAALLLKIVRLAPAPAWHAAIVSPFVAEHGLERRVRRLLQAALEPPAPLAMAPAIGVAIFTIAMALVISSPAALQAIFESLEHLVALGR